MQHLNYCRQLAKLLPPPEPPAPDWGSLRDADVLHANLLRGVPARLSAGQLQHLLGTEVADRNPFAQEVAARCIAMCLSEAAERRRAASTYPGGHEPAFLRGGAFASHQCAERIAAAFGLDVDEFFGRSAPLPPAPDTTHQAGKED